MSVTEITDEMILGMLPATSPEIAVKLSGTDHKRSRDYQKKLQLVMRRMKTLEKFKFVHWDEIKDGARLWEVRI